MLEQAQRYSRMRGCKVAGLDFQILLLVAGASELLEESSLDGVVPRGVAEPILIHHTALRPFK